MKAQEISQALKIAAQKAGVETHPNTSAMVWNAIVKHMERKQTRNKLEAYYAFTKEQQLPFAVSKVAVQDMEEAIASAEKSLRIATDMAEEAMLNDGIDPKEVCTMLWAWKS